MSDVRVGASGWGYPSWQPGFYPPGLDRHGDAPEAPRAALKVRARTG